MSNNRPVLSGIYLVLDPAMASNELLSKLKAALEGGISLVQIWDHWPENFGFEEKIDLISKITGVVSAHNIPVLINEDWRMINETRLDGVHFDEIPTHIDQIKTEINKSMLFGLTCSNDLSKIAWAEQHQFDYISFCAVFPSSSVSSCELVKPETLIKARKMTNIPLFLSGGINLSNMDGLKKYDVQGIAVISGILNTRSPAEITKAYAQKFKDIAL